MLELYLLRHADAAMGQFADIDRPLTDRGVYQAEQMAQRLSEEGVAPQHIIASTATRVEQTLATIAPALDVDLDEIQYEDVVYEASVSTLLVLLSRVPGDCRQVMICGHNPTISQLAGRLCALPAPAFSPATCAIIRFNAGAWAEIPSAQGELTGLLSPSA